MFNVVFVKRRDHCEPQEILLIFPMDAIDHRSHHIVLCAHISVYWPVVVHMCFHLTNQLALFGE